MAGFTPKMTAALLYYSKHRNKTAAYRHAYSCENMKPSSVWRNAVALFDKPLMAAAVSSMRAKAMVETGINAAWVLERAARLANFNIVKFICTDEEGTAVYDFSMATDDDWYCISEYTVDCISKGIGADRYEVERVKIKTESKIRALELVGKHTDVQAFKDTVEHTGVIGVAAVSTDDYKAARAEILAADDC